MSAERALLRRVKVLLECSNMEPLQRQTDLIIGEIKKLLSQREPFKPDWANYRQGVADSKREPLSDAAVCEILLKKEWKGFVDLVRTIEKMHGIGGEE